MIVMEKSDCLCTHRLSVAITQQSCQREKCHKSLNNVSPSLNRRKIASQQISHKNNTKRISTNWLNESEFLPTYRERTGFVATGAGSGRAATGCVHHFCRPEENPQLLLTAMLTACIAFSQNMTLFWRRARAQGFSEDRQARDCQPSLFSASCTVRSVGTITNLEHQAGFAVLHWWCPVYTGSQHPSPPSNSRLPHFHSGSWPQKEL